MKKRSKRQKKTKKKGKKKTKQKGGRTGTSGSFDVLVDDIKSFVVSVVDTIINTTELVVDVFEFPSEMAGKIPYKQPNAPGHEFS